MEFKEAIAAFQKEARETQGAIPRLYPAAQRAIDAHNDLLSSYAKDSLPPPYLYVNELVRTAHMLASLVYALDEQEGAKIRFLEAGCGTGFFLAAALALDGRVEAMGVDMDARATACTRFLLGNLPELNSRLSSIEERDLIQNPGLPFVPDVVIAEHICGDLREEPIDKVQRVLARKPHTAFLPYAIRPYVTTGFEIFVNDGDEDVGIRINPHTLRKVPGQEIILSTNQSPHASIGGWMHVAGKSESVLGLGMDIEWFRGKKRQVGFSLKDNIRAVKEKTPYDSTLVGPHPIIIYDKMGQPSGLLGLVNQTDLDLTARIDMQVALGYDLESDETKKKKRSIDLKVESILDIVEPTIFRFQL